MTSICELRVLSERVLAGKKPQELKWVIACEGERDAFYLCSDGNTTKEPKKAKVFSYAEAIFRINNLADWHPYSRLVPVEILEVISAGLLQREKPVLRSMAKKPNRGQSPPRRRR